MSNPTRALDKTHLSVNQAEARGFIHRDYIAHCLRWTHIARFLGQQRRYLTAHILDIGCGKEAPLARLLYSSRYIPTTGSYTGIDANKLVPDDMLRKAQQKFTLNLLGQTVFPSPAITRQFDVIVCLEVIEHVAPAKAWAMLTGIRKHLAPGGTAFISTPCYDPRVGAANNHINELSYSALEALLQVAGLGVERVFGTFASQRDYVNELSPLHRQLFNRLAEYYDTNYLATIFAPAYPTLSRNCLWRVTLGEAQPVDLLCNVASAEHSSSPHWTALVNKLINER